MSSFTQAISSANGRFANSASGRLDLKHPERWPLSGYNHFNDTGIQVSEKTALAHTAVWRSIMVLSGAVASQAKHVFSRDPDNRRKKQVDREHPVHKLIHFRPNAYQNQWQFHFWLTYCLLHWGNFYAHIGRNAYYEPVSIRPIAPWKVEPKLENGRKVFYVEGAKRSLTNNEVLHVFGLSLDGVKGVNPIQYQAQSVGLGLVSRKFQSSAFGKGANPGGVVTLPEEQQGIMFSTDEEAEQAVADMRKSLESTYSGPENFHKWVLLEPGFKFEQFKMNLETAQLLEALKYNVADVARIYGVQLHKLMELDRATHNNVEQQNIEFVQDGVMPLTTNVEAEYNLKLFREDEHATHYVKINLDSLMRANIKDRYEAYSIALGKNAPGWMEPEEVRDLEDLGEGDPDKWAIPQNMNTRGDRKDETKDAA